ncbi:DEAD/DEAH box helicase [Lacticaseibacillus saniviri]|uniref:DEAD-box ATP-dependent RNA helicase CshB n=1 Tax=Lacticaseibacillus saniviri JCM 17471 = DSM 24301 TaxID=1293598 RepID=A0A0R2MWT5_9LACO|nr:DEAD/DEAH box helicase [Lacticaseibacillus saniviri]KRO17969.1 ATP-dependent RNA helicase [Lacticaseibacillus saniviri JCM 17471 = DSM 24301]MCG4282331.1 DEAD/DEAH box helicase [Lacticaseibacillus saniviri]
MDNQFKQYQLPETMIQALTKMDIVNPTPIQQQVIPAVLRGESVIGQSQTGSGKTHAFLVPIISRINADSDTVQAVITAPSRELANQIYSVASQLLDKDSPIRISRFVGGTDKARQIDKLKRQQPHVVIGTPGRILDLIDANALKSYTANTFVVDEADMTLDMGFLNTVDKIASTFPGQLQMLVFSATIPQKLQPFLKKYMANPTVFEIKPQSVIADTVENWLIAVNSRDRNQLIYQLLTIGQPFLVLIFANTKTSVDKIHAYLTDQGLNVAKIHGDVPPRERNRIMKEVADLKYQFVVATDLAARGIDIKGVSHVINAEIPADNEFFIHRVGRTGRNGMSGTAITLYMPGQEAQIAELEHLGIKFEPKSIKNGEIVDGYDRNRRVNRKPKQEELSQTIQGLAKKEKAKHKPGYKKRVQKAISEERRKNSRIAKREALRASKKANKSR